MLFFFVKTIRRIKILIFPLPTNRQFFVGFGAADRHTSIHRKLREQFCRGFENFRIPKKLIWPVALSFLLDFQWVPSGAQWRRNNKKLRHKVFRRLGESEYGNGWFWRDAVLFLSLHRAFCRLFNYTHQHMHTYLLHGAESFLRS